MNIEIIGIIVGPIAAFLVMWLRERRREKTLEKLHKKREVDLEKSIVDKLKNDLAGDQARFRRDLMIEVDKKTEENKLLQIQVIELKNQTFELQSKIGENETLRNRIAELEEKLIDLQGKYTELEKQLAATQQERDDLHKEVKKLQSVLNNMKKKNSNKQ